VWTSISPPLQIRGKQSEITILHTQAKLPARRVAVVGLGDGDDDPFLALRRAMAAAARSLRDRGCRRVATTLHLDAPEGARPERAVRTIVESAYSGLYRGEEHKTEPEQPDLLDEFTLLDIAEDQRAPAEAAARSARIAGEATSYARRLVNLPPNEITPARLADEASQIARQFDLALDVLGPDRIRELGMGCLAAVEQGSDERGRLIALRRAGPDTGPKLALVGKGLTFDSGGLSLKPSDKMDTMKQDMAGAAAVLAAVRAAAELQLDLTIVGLLPAAENLPSGRSYKPGDVLTAHNGKTVEIANTDAEGRLILADALAYAVRLGATHIVDVATLTGACIVALGHIAAGIMGNDSSLVEALLDAGERAGERMWRLPLFPEYRRLLDSKIADIKNVGDRSAGAIVGGWFLREFVQDVPWAHIDIAGTAWNEKDQPHEVAGATGAATRTLIAFAERLAGVDQ
jgi:leucyl aminopeptidase